MYVWVHSYWHLHLHIQLKSFRVVYLAIIMIVINLLGVIFLVMSTSSDFMKSFLSSISFRTSKKLSSSRFTWNRWPVIKSRMWCLGRDVFDTGGFMLHHSKGFVPKKRECYITTCPHVWVAAMCIVVCGISCVLVCFTFCSAIGYAGQHLPNTYYVIMMS